MSAVVRAERRVGEIEPPRALAAELERQARLKTSCGVSRAASNEAFGIRPFAGDADAGLIDGAAEPGGDERPVVRVGGGEGGLQRERRRRPAAGAPGGR